MAETQDSGDEFESVLNYITPAIKKRRSKSVNSGEQFSLSNSILQDVQASEAPVPANVPLPLDEIVNSDVQRRAYLITYVYANERNFPTRFSFVYTVSKNIVVGSIYRHHTPIVSFIPHFSEKVLHKLSKDKNKKCAF